MLVERHNRFFRLYDITTSPRKKKGAALPLVGQDSLLSLFKDALVAGRAVIPQENGDTIELIKARMVNDDKHVALLFHRANPDAPEPMYRSRVGKGINLRTSEKEDGEEQAYSAHLIIEANPRTPGRYRAALEEIPGLSASAVVGVLRKIAMESEYECNDDRGKLLKTYTVIKCDGYSSESLEAALQQGRITNIDLSKEPDSDLEQDGAYAPSRQRVKLKVSEAITAHNWTRRIGEILSLSKKKGFDDLRVTIDFNDKRSKTISIDREANATELMLVRSKQFSFVNGLDTCYIDLNNELVRTAITYTKE